MKKMILIVCLFMAVVLVFALEPVKLGRKVSSPDSLFHFRAAVNWIPYNDINVNFAVRDEVDFQDSEQPPAMVINNVTDLSGNLPATLKEYMDENLPNYQETLKGQGYTEAYISDMGVVPVNNGVFRWLHITAKEFSDDIVIDRYFAIRSNRLLIITCKARADDYPTARPAFIAMVESLAFDKK